MSASERRRRFGPCGTRVAATRGLLALHNCDSSRKKCPHGDFRGIAENPQVPPALVGTVFDSLHDVQDVARQADPKCSRGDFRLRHERPYQPCTQAGRRAGTDSKPDSRRPRRSILDSRSRTRVVQTPSPSCSQIVVSDRGILRVLHSSLQFVYRLNHWPVNS
jgi:hypothetical protein